MWLDSQLVVYLRYITNHMSHFKTLEIELPLFYIIQQPVLKYTATFIKIDLLNINLYIFKKYLQRIVFKFLIKPNI